MIGSILTGPAVTVTSTVRAHRAAPVGRARRHRVLARRGPDVYVAGPVVAPRSLHGVRQRPLRRVKLQRQRQRLARRHGRTPADARRRQPTAIAVQVDRIHLAVAVVVQAVQTQRRRRFPAVSVGGVDQIVVVVVDPVAARRHPRLRAVPAAHGIRRNGLVQPQVLLVIRLHRGRVADDQRVLIVRSVPAAVQL